jgi:signal transduction histidine kinase
MNRNVPMAAQGFPRLVSLACHDLRTPLATVTGFAKTLSRGGTLGERESRFVGLIEAATDQMASLLDLLALAARIESERYEPVLSEADTLELATSEDARVAAEGMGETIETDAGSIRRSLESLGRCAAIHGGVELVTWRVDGRRLLLSPLVGDAAAVVSGESPRDLGSLVARLAIEQNGGSLSLEDETLVVVL